MGKIKKTLPQEENQKKISSFFQAGTSKPANSELFTHLGGKANQPNCSSKLSLKKTKTDSDKQKFTETKPKDNKAELGDVIDIVSPQKEKEIICSPIFKKTNRTDSNISTCDKEPTVIPESQYFVSPVTPTCKSRGDNKTVSSPCEELLIIPDTPEDSTSEFGKKKKNFSRSFLIGSSSLGRRPCQKVTPDQLKKSKKILHKKKSLISVSVNFNQGTEKLHSQNDITKGEDPSIVCTKKSPEKFSEHEDENVSLCLEMEEDKGPQLSVNISENAEKDTENLWHVDDDSGNSKNSENVEGDTPVKYNDTNSKFKRMSKPGLSPVAKKANSQDDTDIAGDDATKDMKSPEFEKEKVKRVLSLGVSNKRKSLKTRDSTKLNAYQMSMIISNKRKPSKDVKHVNLEDDDVLGEILKELKHTPKCTAMSKGKSSKSPSVYTKNKDSLSGTSNKSLDHFDQSLTEEEMNYFSELDNQLHTKCVTEEVTSKQVVKEYPSLNLVMDVKNQSKTKNINKKKKKSDDEKGGNLVPEDKNTGERSLTLTPDEKSSLPCSLTSSAVIRNEDVDCKIDDCDISRTEIIDAESCDTIEMLTPSCDTIEMLTPSCDTSEMLTPSCDTSEMLTPSCDTIEMLTPSCDTIEMLTPSCDTSEMLTPSCDTSEMLTPSCDVKKIEPTQNIKEFSSQKSLASSATDKGHSEMEIDEYNTQLNSPELCTEFECLSPFKIRPEDDFFRMEPHCRQYGRHLVNKVEYTQGHQNMILSLTDYVTETTRYCQLSGFWADTHIQKEDIVHIIAKTDDQGNYKITDTDGLIIVNPDLLLSGTTVVSSVFCMRKSILNEKFKGCDSKNVQMLYGSIIHCVFQQVLQKKLVEESKILLEAEQVVKQSKYLHEIYANNTTEGEVMEEIKKYIPPLLKWLEEYTNITQNLLCAKKSKTSDIAITKVKDIEENIWSPRFGIKGKIDLTVEVQLKNKNNQKERCTVPLELKTGRPTFSLEHKGQVSLYSMMSSDRREDPKQGLLLYLKEPDMKLIPVDHVNKRGLIQLRNEMAYYLSRKMSKVDSEGHVTYRFGKLPEPINNQRACVKCSQLLNCALYQKTIEHRSVHSGHAMSTLVPNSLSHILPSHMEYYTHWNLMLDLEMQSDVKKGHLKDIWCKTGLQREDVGDCISGLVLSSDIKDNSMFDSAVSIVKFCRHQQHPRFSSPLNLIGLSVDDYIIVSTENSNHIGVCTGSIKNITGSTVELITDRESIPRLYELKSPIFRLDRCNSYNTASIFYSNLTRLMSDDTNCSRLRELLIDKRKPEFVVKLSKSEIEKVKVIFKPLNKPQKTAILKVLMSTDYVLIKGYPGTGKTSTIVALVKVLQSLGYSVLLTSYTHSAVDNILLKLKKDNVKFLRLGKLSKIHPGIHEFAAENLTKKISSVADLRQFYSEQKIVATSSLGTNHSLFTQKKFDVCIVDEASQVLQPACLGPLFSAHKFVLVGDPKQLPPVVQCKEARNLGMDESLFSRLDDSGATYELNLQYRMNSEIMSLSNKLVYNGALQCGSDKVANGQLHLSHNDQIEKIYEDNSWIKNIFISEVYRAAVLLDTEKIPAPEERESSGLIKNVKEARIVYHLVQTLIKGGIDEEMIGVIAPYRNQVKIIREELAKTHSCVEVNTVDQYQGRDKHVIIISFTRCLKGSNQIETKSGELLNDIRRLNVAVTRAKEKLIMIGHKETLQLYQPMSVILNMLEEKNMIINLPETAGQ